MVENPLGSSVGLRRDMEILDLLAGHPGSPGRDGLGVTFIAQRLGREKSQVSRALRSLEIEGMVERDPETRRYRLGWRLFALAARAQHSRITQVAAPFLRGLTGSIDEDSHLCILRGNQVLTLLSIASSRGYHRIWEGVSVPVTMAASGRSLLADWDDEQVVALLRAKPAVGLLTADHDSVQWLADVAHARKHGYAITPLDLEDGEMGLSAPVRDHRGIVAAAISVSADRKADDARLGEMGRLIADTARQLSIALGLPPGAPPITAGGV